jgi:type IV pilus assembly protein PilN
MIAPPYPVLDLLRERRQEVGIDTMSSLLGCRRRLVRRGALIGAGLVGGMALLCGALTLRHQAIREALARLAPMEAEVKALSEQNGQREAAVGKRSATNRELASALTTARTSSALLTELQLRTPVGIRLSSAVVQGPSLVLKGQSIDPQAFGRINALQLELKRSPLLEGNAIRLVKSERMAQAPAAPTAPGQAAVAGGVPVSFEIQGPFAPLEGQRQLAVLRQLGSEGMARRLQLLQSEGLLQ